MILLLPLTLLVAKSHLAFQARTLTGPFEARCLEILMHSRSLKCQREGKASCKYYHDAYIHTCIGVILAPIHTLDRFLSKFDLFLMHNLFPTSSKNLKLETGDGDGIKKSLQRKCIHFTFRHALRESPLRTRTREWACPYWI